MNDNNSKCYKDTLYVHNLNERIPLSELTLSLHRLFRRYGDIQYILSPSSKDNKKPKLKYHGQVWIKYFTEDVSAIALSKLQNYSLYNKPLNIEYSKLDINTILNIKINNKRKKKRKRKVITNKVSTLPKINLVPALPNKLLFIENIPLYLTDTNTTNTILSDIFNRYPGIVEVRTVPIPKPDSNTSVAFIEYETVEMATVAMNALNGFEIMPKHFISVSYAK